jgi:Chlorophyllase
VDQNSYVVETFYPSQITNDSSHPLIVFSIGGGYSGLSVADYVQFLKYMSSNGYIVCAANVNPLTTHDTGVNAETEAEHLIVNYAYSPTFPLANAVNLGAIGAFGHSRGGESVIEQAGTDNRVKVILAMGAANSTNAINNSSYVNVPAMLIFGSQDASSPFNDNVNYYNNFNTSKEYIRISGAGHDLGIWNGTGYGFQYNLTTTPTTEKYALSWFNYYLYSNSSALSVFSPTALANDNSSGIINSYATSGISDSIPYLLVCSIVGGLLQISVFSSLILLLGTSYRVFLVNEPFKTMLDTFHRRRVR